MKKRLLHKTLIPCGVAFALTASGAANAEPAMSAKGQAEAVAQSATAESNTPAKPFAKFSQHKKASSRASEPSPYWSVQRPDHTVPARRLAFNKEGQQSLLALALNQAKTSPLYQALLAIKSTYPSVYQPLVDSMAITLQAKTISAEQHLLIALKTNRFIPQQGGIDDWQADQATNPVANSLNKAASTDASLKKLLTTMQTTMQQLQVSLQKDYRQAHCHRPKQVFLVPLPKTAINVVRSKNQHYPKPSAKSQRINKSSKVTQAQQKNVSFSLKKPLWSSRIDEAN